MRCAWVRGCGQLRDGVWLLRHGPEEGPLWRCDLDSGDAVYVDEGGEVCLVALCLSGLALWAPGISSGNQGAMTHRRTDPGRLPVYVPGWRLPRSTRGLAHGIRPRHLQADLSGASRGGVMV
jgi:hypothetical protein